LSSKAADSSVALNCAFPDLLLKFEIHKSTTKVSVGLNHRPGGAALEFDEKCLRGSALDGLCQHRSYLLVVGQNDDLIQIDILQGLKSPGSVFGVGISKRRVDYKRDTPPRDLRERQRKGDAKGAFLKPTKHLQQSVGHCLPSRSRGHRPREGESCHCETAGRQSRRNAW